MSENNIWPEIPPQVIPEINPPRPDEVGTPVDEFFLGIDLRKAKKALIQKMGEELNIDPEKTRELFENIQGALQWGLSDPKTLEVMLAGLDKKRLAKGFRLFRDKPITEGETLFAIATYVAPDDLDVRSPYRIALLAKNLPLGRLTGKTPIRSAVKAVLFPIFGVPMILDVLRGRHNVRPRLHAIENLLADAGTQDYAKTPAFENIRGWLGMLTLSPDGLLAQRRRDEGLIRDAEFIRNHFPDLTGDGADIVHDFNGETRGQLEYHKKEMVATTNVNAVSREIRTRGVAVNTLAELAHDVQLDVLRVLLKVDLVDQNEPKGKASGVRNPLSDINPFALKTGHALPYIELLQPEKPIIKDSRSFETRIGKTVTEEGLVRKLALAGFRQIADRIYFHDPGLERVIPDIYPFIWAIDAQKGSYLVYRHGSVFVMEVPGGNQYKQKAELIKKIIADIRDEKSGNS